MKLHLIRHGQTETSGISYAGRSDIMLTQAGHAQAQQVAQALQERPISHIFSSPLQRAVDTAMPLVKANGGALTLSPDLMEFDFGAFEGLSKQAQRLKLRKSYATVPVPGGESLWDVWTRAGSFLQTCEVTAPDAEIAVFGHFWINRMIHGRLSLLDFDASCRSHAYRPNTGSIVTFEVSVSFQPEITGVRK